MKNLEILPVLVSSNPIRVIEFYDPDDDTEAISSLDDQPPAEKGLMAIAHENAAMGKLFIIGFFSDPGEVAGPEHGVYVFNNNPVPFCYPHRQRLRSLFLFVTKGPLLADSTRLLFPSATRFQVIGDGKYPPKRTFSV